MPTPVYLDVDTGIDDALALLLAVRHPALEVRGITTVVGNVDLYQVTRNTIQVLDLAGASHIPVVSGANRPLAGAARPASAVHGPDGLGGVQLPPPSRPPTGEDAVGFLRRELLAGPEPVTLIPLAPLTNIALLLQQAPEVRSKIARIALMGGAVGSGNATPVAEFNIFHDPEAAEIVFRSGVPILMYGLDVFYEVCFRREEVARWFGGEGVPALVRHLLEFTMDNFKQEEATIGDAGCVAAVIDPTGLTTRQLPLYVETAGRYCRGQTVVDRRKNRSVEPVPGEESGPLIDVALGVDGERYRQLFLDAILAG